MTEVVGTISQIKVTGALAQLDVTAEIARVVLVSGPAFVSAEIGTTAGNKIVITFDAAFNESYVPATSAFSTTGITGSPTITVVGVSGVTVTLTLSGDATSGDTITVGYTIPGSNPLQDASGKMSSTFAGESVTNNISVFCAEYQAVYVLIYIMLLLSLINMYFKPYWSIFITISSQKFQIPRLHPLNCFVPSTLISMKLPTTFINSYFCCFHYIIFLFIVKSLTASGCLY